MDNIKKHPSLEQVYEMGLQYCQKLNGVMCYNMIIKVLVVATSCKKRGGITPIIKTQDMGEQWKQYPAYHNRQFVKNENNL